MCQCYSTGCECCCHLASNSNYSSSAYYSNPFSSSGPQQREVSRLREANTELRSLVNRLDDITSSLETSASSFRPSRRNSQCCCSSTAPSYYNTYGNQLNTCNVCRDLRSLSSNHYQYTVDICSDCERMLSRRNSWSTLDRNVYPLTKYPHGNQRYCSNCERCVDERIRRARSRSRSRSASIRRRSISRSYYDYSDDDADVQRPFWMPTNKAAYPWRDDKLKESTRSLDKVLYQIP